MLFSNLFLSLQNFIDFHVKMNRHRVQIFYIHEKYFMNVKYKNKQDYLKTNSIQEDI